MAKNISYCDIAYKILKQEEKARSLHYKEISKRAFEEKLIDDNNIMDLFDNSQLKVIYAANKGNAKSEPFPCVPVAA